MMFLWSRGQKFNLVDYAVTWGHESFLFFVDNHKISALLSLLHRPSAYIEALFDLNPMVR